MSQHTILLLQKTKDKKSRTYMDCNNVSLMIDQVINLYEVKLKESNINRREINYTASDLLNYIDNVGDLACMVLDVNSGTYIPHDREWIKQMKPTGDLMEGISLNIIVAKTAKNGIGLNNILPWKIKRDMKLFKSLTTSNNKHQGDSDFQNIVIMGRNTWDSIPNKFKPLKDRLNIVLSRNTAFQQLVPPKVQVFQSLEASLNFIKEKSFQNKNIWIIGGSQIYKEVLELNITKKIFLTHIYNEVECNTYIDLKLDKFRLIKDAEEIGIVLKNYFLDGEEQDEFKFNHVFEEDGYKFEFLLYNRD
ncbi:hypothetical protein HDU92_000267 [Lobulomyces angularis]|nr:hypothetical protein HDU92_000267 [Lobulomyces angularis]